MEELKNELISLIMELRVDIKVILEVAPNTLPLQLQTILKVPENRVKEDFDKLIESVEEGEREEFLKTMLMVMGATKKSYVDLKDSLNRRIQPEGEERAKPRKFQGFRKRRGTW